MTQHHNSLDRTYGESMKLLQKRKIYASVRLSTIVVLG